MITLKKSTRKRTRSNLEKSTTLAPIKKIALKRKITALKKIVKKKSCQNSNGTSKKPNTKSKKRRAIPITLKATPSQSLCPKNPLLSRSLG